MDERTLTVLRGSIRKWERIVDGTGVDAGTINCPLCRINREEAHWSCVGWIENDEQREAALAELAFLRSLLPTTEETR